MTLPGGAGSQFGMKAESVYGTAVTVDRFLHILNESLGVETQPYMSRGIGGGSGLLQRSDRYKQIVTGAAGDTAFDITTKGFGVALKAALGSGSIAQVASTTEWKQTHILDITSGEVGLSHTLQKGMADNDGTATAWTYEGCKVVGVEFACDQGGALTMTLTWACETGTQGGASAYALQVASYAVDTQPFTWNEGTVTLNSVSRIMKSWNLSIAKNFELERYGIGSVLRREPVPNGEIEVTGEMDAEFENVTDYAAFVAGTVVPLVVTFTSPLMITGASNPYKIVFTLDGIVFTGDTPKVGGMDLIRQPLPFKALWDGSDPMIKVEYHSSDVAL